MIGLFFSGLYSNGFSLVRKVMEKIGFGYDVFFFFNNGKIFGMSKIQVFKGYDIYVFIIVIVVKFVFLFIWY